MAYLCERGAEVMTNQAAIGYAILAAKRLNLAPIVIKAVEEAMYREMDERTEEEAEEAYRKS